ncbi:MAG: hypothetical protein BJ554DRAFT_1056 [Olpidium bornovanus]|uniref:Uncharacterized protein n=1 Tax=Olpidium bornovanus TaxID=278681 RepID=A0A8H8DHR2_9FUNG|nr:MAG: hypothetical protein BJ554DRAFT_1056 [Olpidium bornovanus]
MPAGARRTPALFLLVGTVLFLNAAAHFAHRRPPARTAAAPQDAARHSPHALVRRGPPAEPSPPPTPLWIAASDGGGGGAGRGPAAAGKTAFTFEAQCDGIHLQSDKCSFVRANCNGMATGMFNYLEFYYCSAAAGVIPFVALVWWLGRRKLWG